MNSNQVEVTLTSLIKLIYQAEFGMDGKQPRSINPKIIRFRWVGRLRSKFTTSTCTHVVLIPKATL